VRHAVALALAVAVALGAAAPASGYVRSRTDMGTPIYWASGCAFLEPDAAGSVDLSADIVSQILNQSIANWQNAAASCSFLKIQLESPGTVEARLDYKNVIKFRTGTWCRPAEDNMAEVCYSPMAAAITTVFYNDDKGKSDDGAIQDADIQLNQIDFTFVWINHTVPPIRPGTTQSDLENTLTHELGHFQGLDHTCWDHQPPYTTMAPVDENGNAIPDCADVIMQTLPPAEEQQVVQSTMFNFASPGETIKRMPKADDVAGICAIYPTAKDPKSCTHVSHGCALGTPGGAAPWLVGAALLALALRRRRYGTSL
jgi:MYXO-CTERM domain-containing protein